MSLLFETILVENAKPVNIIWHEKRMNAARRHFFNSDPIELSDHIPQNTSANEKYRCRIEYDDEIRNVFLNILRYQPVDSIQIVEDNYIDYSYKYCDRKAIDLLFVQRRSFDDILIIKNGFVTDSSKANIVFLDNKKYFTPSTPLLEGTQRSSLISKGIIEEREIRKEDIHLFSAWQLINALKPFDPRSFRPIESIHE
jgi:4-amino-4-deoxychorismate lyase